MSHSSMFAAHVWATSAGDEQTKNNFRFGKGEPGAEGPMPHHTNPPSTLRYALLLLKARPSISDIRAIENYSSNKPTPHDSSPASHHAYFAPLGFVLPDQHRVIHDRDADQHRGETPPPPYAP
ncbi:hypothetical protein EJ04DRAFT_523876 [Polyplosphaeria fusca]|uniref:Uncharacterized protein n=1 Tax=Polyplosphaeria fusca TaxID=682080 RepID=A0A9P4QUV7_9PLEO|nr:hypothetical protein EJ04DRAFT_523876 [Polyplosphaeria fusca]